MIQWYLHEHTYKVSSSYDDQNNVWQSTSTGGDPNFLLHGGWFCGL